MSDLIFYEDTHQYELDGELLPSVSEIIRFISREHYADINPVYIERAAERGTRIHKACEQLDLTGECDVDEDIVPYVEAYTAFLNDYKPKWLCVEMAGYSTADKHLGFAGTIDRKGLVNGHDTIVDIKSSAQPYLPAVKAQLGGYALIAKPLITLNDIPVQNIAMLQLKKDGTYKYQEFDEREAYNLFDACYTIHKATEKKKKKGDGLLLL